MCLKGVYPRVCGGTIGTRSEDEGHWGLSPRVRGNRSRCGCFRAVSGSIPACAGEPRTPSDRCPPGRVYPRVCGGTLHFDMDMVYLSGLSPRVRGNPRSLLAGTQMPGSIPACAGEPSLHERAPECPGVYPRVCGGTMRTIHDACANQGLSPRVRGNRNSPAMGSISCGSIPACAGEPPRYRFSARSTRVYPRVCGGTTLSLAIAVNG